MVYVSLYMIHVRLYITYGPYMIICEPCMIIYEPYMIIYGSYMVIHGPNMTIYGPCMIIYGPYMIIFGPYMIMYGPYMIIYGPYMYHIWTTYVSHMGHGRSTCIRSYNAQFPHHASRGVQRTEPPQVSRGAGGPIGPPMAGPTGRGITREGPHLKFLGASHAGLTAMKVNDHNKKEKKRVGEGARAWLAFVLRLVHVSYCRTVMLHFGAKHIGVHPPELVILLDRPSVPFGASY